MRAALALVPSQPLRDPIAQAVNNMETRLFVFAEVYTAEQRQRKAREFALDAVKAVLALTKEAPTPLRSLPQAERENRGSGQIGETTGRESYRCIYCNRQVADLDNYEPYCSVECSIDAAFNR